MDLRKNLHIVKSATGITISLLFIIIGTLLFSTPAVASACTTPTDPTVASICTYLVDIDNPFATDSYGNSTFILRPGNIVYGSDGNVWFLSSVQSLSTIIRMSPTGTITTFNLTNGNVPVNIINGPDGNIWFAEQGTVGGVGFITPDGKITEYPVSGSTVPNNITAGSDGNFWFNDLGAIWRITPGGVATKFPLPSGYGNNVGSMTTGSDGNLWFAGDNYIGRLTPTGSYTAFTTPTATSGIFKLVKGSDGNLWFGDYSTNKIGRITPTGTITEFSLPDAADISLKGGITLGPDGNIWFTGIFNNFNAFVPAGDLESITPAGVITDYRLQNENIVPIDLTSDPNGNLWATSDNVNWSGYAIMRIQVSNATSSPTSTPTQTPTPTPTVTQDTGFRPSTDGFGFHNFDTSIIPLAAFNQFFGVNLTSNDISQSLSAAATYYNQAYKTVASGGNCFGISGAAAINYEHLSQQNVGSFALPYFIKFYSSVTDHTFKPSGATYNLQDILGYYSGVQRGAEYEENKTSTSYNLAAIEQSIQKGQPAVITMQKIGSVTHTKSELFGLKKDTYTDNELEGHAILAYRYQIVGNTVQVYVYDSNHEVSDGLGDSDTKYITFNLTNDSWSYDPDDSDGIWGSNALDGAMQVVPINIFTDKGISPWDISSDSDVFVPPTMGAYISDTNGGSTGFVNGQFNNQANGVSLLPMLDDNISSSSADQEFMTTTGNPYNINVSNVSGEQGPINIYGNNAYLSLTGLTPSVSDSAQIQLGSDSKSATVSASSPIASYSATLDQEASGKSLIFIISGATINPGETNTFKLIGDNGELSIQDNGSNKTYNLQIQEVGGNNSTITFNNISINQNMTQSWIPQNWDSLSSSPITLTEDKNSDGKSITSVVANAVTINGGAKYTNSNKVTLHLVPPFTATKMRISNIAFNKNQQVVPQWQKFSTNLNWSLLAGQGKYTVYVQFMTVNGTVSDVYSSSIILDTLPPVIYGVSINNGSPFTNFNSVNIKINAQDGLSNIQSMKVSNTSNLSNINWQSYENNFNWTLTPLSNSLPQIRWIYIQLKDNAGNTSQIFKSAILLL